jgi:hypothetical protein
MSHASCDCSSPSRVSTRRKFLQFAALGSGISLLACPSLFTNAHAAGGTEALLLSCMDYRLMDKVEQYMSQRGLRNQYDHVILAGAALGAITISSQHGTKPSGSIWMWQSNSITFGV